MDNYGQMLQQGELQSRFFVERDDGYITGYSFEEWLGEAPKIGRWEKKILDHHIKEGTVLDVGCGTGKHVAYLNKQGNKACGIDLSEEAVKIGQSYHRPIEVMDFWGLEAQKTYDNIIIFDSSLGLVSNGPKDLGKVFEKIQGLLSPGGRFITMNVNWPKASNEIYQKYIVKNIKNGDYPGKAKLRFKTDDFTGDWFNTYYIDLNSLMELAIPQNFYPIEITINEGIKYAVTFEHCPEKIPAFAKKEVSEL